jgi:hypothetical protein
VEIVQIKTLSLNLVIYLILNDAKVCGWIFNLRDTNTREEGGGRRWAGGCEFAPSRFEGRRGERKGERRV